MPAASLFLSYPGAGSNTHPPPPCQKFLTIIGLKNKSATLRWIPILIVVFTAVLRLAFLAIKPPHFDEGVNGWFIDQMVRTGHYHYDPSNYHGPLHFYILFVFERLLGRNLWALRLPAVIASTLTVWLVTRFDRFLDRRTCWLAALAMAVSPGAEFYGRYAIHESEMVLFLILTVWGLAGLRQSGAVKYLWAAGVGVTGMILTKETYIIHLATLALAVPAVFILEKFSPSNASPPAKQLWSRRNGLTVAAAGIGLIVFFYSGTFFDFPTLKGLYLTFAEWFKTGQEGNGHEKPFFYWTIPIHLKFAKWSCETDGLMTIYEWPALLGLAASPFCVLPKSDRLIRFLAIYACGALVAYSIIPYKTPWCIITILWPFFFLFGDLFKNFAEKIGSLAALSLAAILLASSLAVSVRLNFFHYTDEKEPYVYVQTFKDINKLTEPLFKLVARDPSNRHLTGSILLDSYHPLPWVLGDFTDIGYYDEKDAPENMDADFLLVEPSRVEEVESALKEDYFTGELRLRGSMEPAKLYLNCKKFGVLFPNRKAGFTQGNPARTNSAR